VSSLLLGVVDAWEQASGQFLAAGRFDPHNATDGLAILDRDHPDRDRIARLEGTLEPAHVSHGGRIFRLRHPMRYLAALIGGVEQNHAMGISPDELGDSPLEIDLFRGVVGRITVVRGERKGKGRKTEKQSEGD